MPTKFNDVQKNKNCPPRAGENIIFWRYFDASGPGEQVRVQGLMDKSNSWVFFLSEATGSSSMTAIQNQLQEF